MPSYLATKKVRSSAKSILQSNLYWAVTENETTQIKVGAIFQVKFYPFSPPEINVSSVLEGFSVDYVVFYGIKRRFLSFF